MLKRKRCFAQGARRILRGRGKRIEENLEFIILRDKGVVYTQALCRRMKRAPLELFEVTD